MLLPDAHLTFCGVREEELAMGSVRWMGAVLISVLFLSDVGAQDRADRRGALIRQWMEKKRDEHRIDSNAVGVATRLNLPYLDDQSPYHQLDVYIPPQKVSHRPVLVHIHGGGWEIGDKSMQKATGLFYASQGVLFVAPNYRLSPQAQHPAHAEDCAAAVAWAFQHAAEFGGDPKRIYLSGHSAGAHLAALLATDPVYLKRYGLAPESLAGVIPVDAATYDLNDANNEPLVKKFIQDSFGPATDMRKSASPLNHLDKAAHYPRFLVLNTTTRASASAGAKCFADALQAAGGDVQFVPVDKHTHAEMATGMYNLTDPVGCAIFAFLNAPVKPQATSASASAAHP